MLVDGRWRRVLEGDRDAVLARHQREVSAILGGPLGHPGHGIIAYDALPRPREVYPSIPKRADGIWLEVPATPPADYAVPEARSSSLFTRSSARRWMQAHADEHTDPRTGELNLTAIAEACAAAFGVDGIGGPLDDETHWIWEVPVTLAGEIVS